MDTLKKGEELGLLNKPDQQDSKNSYKLVDRKSIEGTPFDIISTEAGHFVVMGKSRLSEAFETIEEAEKDAAREDWNRQVQVMEAVWLFKEDEKKFNEILKG